MHVITAVLFWIGTPLVLMASCYGAVLVYRSDSARRNDEGRSIANYAGGAIGAGCLAMFLLWFVGIPATCGLFYPGSVDCGFWAGLGMSPLAFALGIAAFIGWWRWRGQTP
jgi:hypothetical protein